MTHHMRSNEKEGKTSRKHRSGLNRTGWIAEGLLAALFVGLVLFVLLFTWMPTTAIFVAHPILGYVCMALVITAAMFPVYWGVAVYRERRFQLGGRDHLMMRSLMASCLAGDCGEIEKRLAASNNSDFSIFNQMVLCKVQDILDHECLKISDVHTRFRESRLRRIKGVHFEVFFKSCDAYDSESFPTEIESVSRALQPFGLQMRTLLSELESSRRSLFTIMSDYPDMLIVTESDVAKLQKTYRFKPPEFGLSQKIVFANKTIDYLKNLQNGKLSDEQRSVMEKIASQNILRLKSAVSDYRNSWKKLVEAYEGIPLSRKASKGEVI